MDAITMPSISWLSRLRADYPQFRFQNAHVARWSHRDQTVYYEPLRSQAGKITLLHELGHAICGHITYHQDIELLRCEREAWHQARAIAPRYDMTITEATIDQAIDTYRRWLHDRSRCPRCGHGATQSRTLSYRCILCDTVWTANDARQCGLKRYVRDGREHVSGTTKMITA